VSSAILYLAIVAIWACVLVPRWLRRPHEQPSDQEAVFETYDSGQAEAGEIGEPVGDAYAPDVDTQREQGAAAYGEPVAWEELPVPDHAEGVAEASYSVTATYSAEVTYSSETTADEPAPDAYYDYGAQADGGDPPYHYHVTHDAAAEDWQQEPADGWQQPYARVPSPGPSPHVVQARRRTLTMVLLITVAVMGSAFIGLTPWWTAFPPFIMLGLFLLLLREAARADFEHAHIWVEAQARAAQAAHRAELARERARQAEVASQPEPTAQIITLATPASRADDQLYDQYADAEIRAVGD
jgi:hypothetical protein